MFTNEEIAKLIEESEDVDFGNGISLEQIKQVESQLEIKLPKDYVWWLSQYNGGEVCGDELYSIYSTRVHGDLLHMNKINRLNFAYPIQHIVICRTNYETYYLKLDETDEAGLSPVYTEESGKYANSFHHFLVKFITEE
jgi:hypothetical protein